MMRFNISVVGSAAVLGLFLVGLNFSAVFAAEQFLPVSALVPYQSGEVIRYNIKQAGIKVGEASLTWRAGESIDGRTMNLVIFVSSGIRFYDEERIYLDPRTFRPVRVLRDLNIFGNKEKITEEYLPDGTVEVVKEVGGKMTRQILPRQGNIDNIYGFIYRYRAQGDFSAGQPLALRLPTLDVNMRVAESVDFHAAGKNYNAAVMRSEPSKYTIWMDRGPQRLPLRIAGAVGVANTVMTMVGYDEVKTNP